MTDDLQKDLENELETEELVVDEEADLAPADALKKLREKLKIAISEKQSYLDGWQRDKAEFVNARKRDEESKQQYLKFAAAQVIDDMLPVVDAFDMAIGNKEVWKQAPEVWRKGMEGIYNQFLTALSKNNVVPFGTSGDIFDPNFYHSVAMMPTDEEKMNHMVAEILQKGYKIKDKVLRPAMVKVYEYNQ